MYRYPPLPPPLASEGGAEVLSEQLTSSGHGPPTGGTGSTSPPHLTRPRSNSSSEADDENRADSSTGQDKPPLKRRRVIVSCLQCRKRKTHCDRERPSCTECLERGWSCDWSDSTSAPYDGRTRIVSTCVECRRRKISCDRIRPSCTMCSDKDLPCEYPANPPRIYAHAQPLSPSTNDAQPTHRSYPSGSSEDDRYSQPYQDRTAPAFSPHSHHSQAHAHMSPRSRYRNSQQSPPIPTSYARTAYSDLEPEPLRYSSHHPNSGPRPLPREPDPRISRRSRRGTHGDYYNDGRDSEYHGKYPDAQAFGDRRTGEMTSQHQRIDGVPSYHDSGRSFPAYPPDSDRQYMPSHHERASRSYGPNISLPPIRGHSFNDSRPVSPNDHSNIRHGVVRERGTHGHSYDENPPAAGSMYSSARMQIPLPAAPPPPPTFSVTRSPTSHLKRHHQHSGVATNTDSQSPDVRSAHPPASPGVAGHPYMPPIDYASRAQSFRASASRAQGPDRSVVPESRMERSTSMTLPAHSTPPEPNRQRLSVRHANAPDATLPKHALPVNNREYRAPVEPPVSPQQNPPHHPWYPNMSPRSIARLPHMGTSEVFENRKRKAPVDPYKVGEDQVRDFVPGGGDGESLCAHLPSHELSEVRRLHAEVKKMHSQMQDMIATRARLVTAGREHREFTQNEILVAIRYLVSLRDGAVDGDSGGSIDEEMDLVRNGNGSGNGETRAEQRPQENEDISKPSDHYITAHLSESQSVPTSISSSEAVGANLSNTHLSSLEERSLPQDHRLTAFITGPDVHEINSQMSS